ncbi:hypothetical protein PHSY_003554 [Pseudozyma hubeiensis SY62]|uniref:Uncharacterized protein n=1 Tax=Pseudozyma hubeiensis (strain SY62) TaxID=1305764 RepID=R9P3N9_PSEHS|nr:hypothetical protein PHSY_003554 [Pseudozyma hubeiensis SY62]GAC95976.1 hypothetical protein PHSY_003554 [Pseudozyma hubeiensis SY62]
MYAADVRSSKHSEPNTESSRTNQSRHMERNVFKWSQAKIVGEECMVLQVEVWTPRATQSMAKERSEDRIRSVARASSMPPCPSLHWLRRQSNERLVSSRRQSLQARLDSVYGHGDTAEKISSTQYGRSTSAHHRLTFLVTAG